ncbi:MAG: LacI family transcriptional regulator [Oscillospiraceae bacterium]|jgi:DNA-binding LacI/PurR family transcriptional regulator|nr:LacI family transcriptional regulator [Oscillospiraceae bacterium]
MAAETKTILDIAREAGVSPATVSRVLSGHPNVSAKTSAKVQTVVDKYRFKPNSIARGLLQKHSKALGIIMPDIKHPYYASVFSAAQEEARRHGYVVQLYRLAYNAMITDDFANQLIERRLDGVMLCGGFIESTGLSGLPAVLTRLQQYMPIVTICPPIPGLSCINIYADLAAGLRKLVRHLYNLGHRRIAFIGATAETRSMGEREQGFTDEMLHLGLDPIMQPENIHTPAMGEQAVLKLLSAAPPAEWPTALAVVNDLMALGVLRQLHAMGLRLPEDMAVVGCDNQFFSAFTSPPLTTLDVYSEEHGAAAMRQLLQAQETHAAPFTQTRDPTLIVRESCGAQLDRRTPHPQA